MFSPLVGDDTHQVQCIRMALIHVEYFLIKGFSLGQAPTLMMLNCNLKCPSQHIPRIQSPRRDGAYVPTAMLVSFSAAT